MPGVRPTKMTPERIGKLEEAFAIGASDREACFYADINLDTLYEYQKKHPEFTERKEALKERPVLLARQTVVKNITQDADLAFKYLERKRRVEFATRVEQENSGELNLKYQELKDDQLDARLNAILERRKDSTA